MSNPDKPISNRERKIENEKFIEQQALEFESGKYSDIEMPGLFENAFNRWTFKDYTICTYKKLQILRAALRGHGVPIQQSESKTDLILKLMDAASAPKPSAQEIASSKPTFL